MHKLTYAHMCIEDRDITLTENSEIIQLAMQRLSEQWNIFLYVQMCLVSEEELICYAF